MFAKRLVEPHRRDDAQQALAQAHEIADSLGYRLKLHDRGSVGDFRVVASTLGRRGEVVATGAGKGLGQQAEASAAYEALEHFFMTAHNNPRLGDLSSHRMSFADIAQQPGLSDALHVQRIAQQVPSAQIRAFELHSDHGSIFWPAFLSVVDWLEYPPHGDEDVNRLRPFAKYSVNTGFAAAARSDEARLHALCELIERDSNSLALINALLLGEAQTAIATEDQPWGEALRQLAADSLRTPVVIDTTTDIEVPSFMAVLPRGSAPEPLWGSGASPDRTYAYTRAVAELLQVYVISQHEHISARDGFVPRTALCEVMTNFDCLRHDKTDLLTPQDRWGGLSEAQPLDDLLDVSQHLGRAGLDHFYLDVTAQVPNISVTLNIVPGLEMFELASQNIPILPTGRGAEAVTRYLSTIRGNHAALA